VKADSIIQWLMPKDNQFRGLLAEDTQNLLLTARLFSDIAACENVEERRVKVVLLKALEHSGDHITQQIFEALNASFITPLDREDLRALASCLDDIVDLVDEVAQYLVLFELSEAPEALRQFAEILLGMAENIDRVTGLLWNLKNEQAIQAAIVHVSDLENQGDALYNTVIADLFKPDGKTPTEILKWKEVYDGLEDACDACKDYSHVVANVMIKNA
jgi:predicted phosphate transport protein (TIGR00153 family)